MTTVKVVPYAGSMKEASGPVVLPTTGIVTLPTLAQVMHMSADSLIEALREHKIGICKLGKRRSTWFIQLDELTANVTKEV